MPEANNGFREFLHRLAIKTRQGLKKFMRAGLPYASVRYKGNVRRSFFEGACWVAFGSVRYKPKSVIRHAESVSDWENEAFGHLARFCPHPVSRYAST